MRAISASALLCLFVSCAGLRAPGPVIQSPVRYCDIMSRPEGEPMSLIAVYRQGFEEQALVDPSDCVTGLNFWVEFSEDVQRNSDPEALRLFNKGGDGSLLVRFRGSYQCFRSGHSYGFYGHLDGYTCQFTVTAIEHVFGRVGPAEPRL
jgi:hypothetical protein